MPIENFLSGIKSGTDEGFKHLLLNVASRDGRHDFQRDSVGRENNSEQMIRVILFAGSQRY